MQTMNFGQGDGLWGKLLEGEATIAYLNFRGLLCIFVEFGAGCRGGRSGLFCICVCVGLKLEAACFNL